MTKENGTARVRASTSPVPNNAGPPGPFREAPSSNTNAVWRRHGGQPPAIILVGAGGFGREILQYIEDALVEAPDYVVKGFLDDGAANSGRTINALPVLGDTYTYAFEPSDRVIVAIGTPLDRLKAVARLEASHVAFLTIVHPRAYVAETASLGVGCIVAPFATVGAEAKIGAHSFLTFGASVAHHASVGRGCGLSPYSVANGGSILDDGVFLGTHAVVNPYRTVGEGSKVAAGAVIYHDVPPGVMAHGNPARTHPMWSPE